ncbi:hypothetical protein [Salinisphaera sp. T31B1]|uniref:hypothetical protein n=1 Tax=Salinisphaera sp. T31B1 TaxID=727963 RepID=UPI0033401308
MTTFYRIQDSERLKSELGAAARHVETAKRRAISAVTAKAATFISRDIRDVFAIRAKDIKSALSVRKYEKDAKALLYTGGKIPLEKFGGKDKRVSITATSRRGKKFKTSRRAATARVRKDKGRQVVRPGGFLAKGRIYRRREQDKNDSTLVPMFGPSIPGLVAHPETIRGAQDLVRDELPKEFDRNLRHLLGDD